MRLGECGCAPRTDFALFPAIAALAAPVARGLRPAGGRGGGRLSHEAVHMTTETWTPERVEQLRGYVATGLSCSQIAAQIGVTRNAVIGKIHRLGLSPGRPPGGSARTCPPRARHPRAASPQRLLRLMWADGGAAALAEPLAVASAQPCTLLDLAQGKCRWPLEDQSASGAAADFNFCGNEAVAGLSYCAGHARMAYRMPARRRA